MDKSGEEYLSPRSQEEHTRSETPPASLGIDVANAPFDVALLWAGKLTQRTFSMDPDGFTAVDRWIRQHGVEQVHACLEATGEYGGALALALQELGHVVSMVNPARIAAYAKSRLARTKTDNTVSHRSVVVCRLVNSPVAIRSGDPSPYRRRRHHVTFVHTPSDCPSYALRSRTDSKLTAIPPDVDRGESMNIYATRQCF